MPLSRTIRLPAADFASRTLPEVRLGGLDALRVCGAGYPALRFRVVPGHRFSHPDAPAGLMYLGERIDTCLWEVFGDTLLDEGTISANRWRSTLLSRIRSGSTFRICDLADENVRLHLGVDLGALMSSDLGVPHAWGLALQSHPAAVDGLRYLSRFDSRACLVLFERPWMDGQLAEAEMGSLAALDEAARFLNERSITLI